MMLEKLIDIYKKLKEEQANLEKQIMKNTEELKELTTRHLPEMLITLGFNTVEMDDGTKVTTQTVYYGSLKKEMASEAIALLASHGYAETISQEVKVGAPLNTDGTVPASVTAVLDFVISRNLPVKMDLDYKIHHKTLQRVLKELVEKGADKDKLKAYFNLFEVVEAKIK